MVERLCESPIGNVASDDPADLADPASCSDVFPRPPPTATLSAQLWGLDFARLLPRELGERARATAGELPRIREFLANRFPCLTEEAAGCGLSPSSSDAKRRYLVACDLIELRSADETVGAIVGAPEDWSTYYVRIFAIAREFQRPGLVRKLVRECIFEPLRERGVQRLCADTSPANRAMARLFSELDFHATGHQLSDRWGPLVRYTKFLDDACETVFLERFGGSAPTRRIGTKERR